MKILDYTEYIFEKLSGSLVLKERKKMRKILRENIVTFKFQKRDGSIRKAHGTLHPDFLPELKGTGGPRPAYQMVYYDLDKFGWRSFRSFKFIKIIKQVSVTDELVDEFMLKKEEEERRREEERRHHTSIREKERREKERIEKSEREEKEKEEKEKHKETEHEEKQEERKKKKHRIGFEDREKDMERRSEEHEEKRKRKESRMMEGINREDQ